MRECRKQRMQHTIGIEIEVKTFALRRNHPLGQHAGNQMPRQQHRVVVLIVDFIAEENHQRPAVLHETLQLIRLGGCDLTDAAEHHRAVIGQNVVPQFKIADEIGSGKSIGLAGFAQARERHLQVQPRSTFLPRTMLAFDDQRLQLRHNINHPRSRIVDLQTIIANNRRRYRMRPTARTAGFQRHLQVRLRFGLHRCVGIEMQRVAAG